MPVSLQQLSYHQGWSVHLYGIDNDRWFCVIERIRELNSSMRWSGIGSTIQEAVDVAWKRARPKPQITITMHGQVCPHCGEGIPA